MAMPRLDFLQVLLQGSDAQVNEHQQLEIYGFKYTPLLHTLRHSRTPQFRTLSHCCAFIRFISTNIQTCENFFSGDCGDAAEGGREPQRV